MNWRRKKIFWAHLQKNIEQLSLRSRKYGWDPRSGIRDPGSKIRDPEETYSGYRIPGPSRGQKDRGSRIPGTQHCIKRVEEKRPKACEVLLVMMTWLPAGVGEGEVNKRHLRLAVLGLRVLVRLCQRRLTQLNRQTGKLCCVQNNA